MSFSFIRWLIFIPVSLIVAYSFKEVMFYTYEENGFFSTSLIWFVATFFFMISIVSLAPSKKYSVVKYSFWTILFYSLVFILVELGTWEYSGSFDLVKFAAYAGCLAGGAFSYISLKDKYPKDDNSDSEITKILNEPYLGAFDLLPPDEQDNLRKQAIEQLENEKTKNQFNDYEVSEASIIKRANIIFEKKVDDEQHTKMTRSERLKAQAFKNVMENRKPLTRGERLLLKTMKERKERKGNNPL